MPIIAKDDIYVLDAEDVEGGSRYIYISLLRIVACVSVVFMHTNAVLWGRPHGGLWLSANFINSMFIFAVPVFFMISGALLIDYSQRYSSKMFFKKRFIKTFVPFVVWSLIYGVFLAKIENQSFDLNVFHIIDNVLNARYCGAYWFFPVLFSAYLCFPLLSAVEKKVENFISISLLGTLLIGTIPLIFEFFELGSWTVQPPILLHYMNFILIGYVLSKIKFTKIARRGVYVLGFLGFLIIFIGTMYKSIGSEEVSKIFYGSEQGLPIVLYSVAIFVFFKNLNFKRIFKSKFDSFVKVINYSSSLTLGIYLIHPFFTLIAYRILPIDVASLSWRVGGAIIIILACACLTTLIKKVSIIKHTL